VRSSAVPGSARPASFALGRVAGFIVASAQHPRSFQTLYLLDAITHAAFALVVLATVPNRRAAASALWAIALLGVLPATLIHSELGATARHLVTLRV
jgi:hypothetical protein